MKPEPLLPQYLLFDLKVILEGRFFQKVFIPC